MAVITLLKNFTFFAAPGQSMRTDWVSFPEEHQNAQLVVIIKTGGAVGASGTLEATWDTDVSATVTTVALAAPGTTIVNITPATGPLGPLVRFALAAAGVALNVNISVFLTPKSE